MTRDDALRAVDAALIEHLQHVVKKACIAFSTAPQEAVQHLDTDLRRIVEFRPLARDVAARAFTK